MGLGVRRAHPPLLPPCQLPLSLYKKVLVIMHDAILPHLAQPTLMIDFLTRAYDVGECRAPLPAGWAPGTGAGGAMVRAWCVLEPESPPWRDGAGGLLLC